MCLVCGTSMRQLRSDVTLRGLRQRVGGARGRRRGACARNGGAAGLRLRRQGMTSRRFNHIWIYYSATVS